MITDVLFAAQMVRRTDLKKLWDTTITPARTRLETRKRHQPTYDEFFAETVEQLDPVNDVEKQYWNINNENFVWRAMRVVGRHNFKSFQDRGEKTFPDFLEGMLAPKKPVKIIRAFCFYVCVFQLFAFPCD